MAQAGERSAPASPGAAFREGRVEADGFRIRYVEAGQGAPVLHLHGVGGLRLTRAHDLLAQRFRVVAFEMPGFGQSPENMRTESMPELASTMARAATKLGLDAFNLMGTSFGATAALWLALQAPARVSALVLEAPTAIRPEGAVPPTGALDEVARRLYAHPERLAAVPAPDPAIQAKTQRLVQRLSGPARDRDLEGRLQELVTPTLVLFGTADGVIPPAAGRIYMELIPTCHLVFVYDAGHAIGTERPEAFAEVVGDFLERRDAFVISRATTAMHP